LSIRMRALLLVVASAAGASVARGQSWAAGLALGATENVSHSFSLDEMRARDINGWIQYEAEPDVYVRATIGSLRTTAANSDQVVTPPGTPPIQVPHLTSQVDYATIGASYEFVTGDIASGIFGGLGGYRIRPHEIPPGFEFAADPKTTVLGWHLGVDGSFRILKRLAAVGRLTIHGYKADVHQTIFTAGAGLAYRF